MIYSDEQIAEVKANLERIREQMPYLSHNEALQVMRIGEMQRLTDTLDELKFSVDDLKFSVESTAQRSL